MDSLMGAAVAAGAAWASVLAAVLLPVPEAWFQRLRWVGAATIVLVGLGLLGAPVPSWAPPAVLGAGVLVVVGWPVRGRDRRPA